MITILIPTYNRVEFLERALRYYDTVGFDGFLSIGDSSRDDIARQNLQNVLKYSRKLKIVYRHFPKTPKDSEGFSTNWVFGEPDGGISYRDGGIVLSELGKTAPTPFVVFSGDDDFLVPATLAKCVRFLKENPDYSAAHGLRIHFTLGSQENYHGILKTEYIPEHVLVTEEPLERLRCYLRYAYSTQFYVHRRETWQRMYASIGDITNHYLGAEVLPCSMTCILGKVWQLDDCIGTVFQESYGYEKSFSWLTHSMYGLTQEANWYFSIQQLRRSLKGELGRTWRGTPAALQEWVDRELWAHINEMLAWQYTNKYGERAPMELSFNPKPFRSSFEMMTSPRWQGFVAERRGEYCGNLERQGCDAATASQRFDQYLWFNLVLLLDREYMARYGNERAWYDEHRRRQGELHRRFDAPLLLHNLLDPLSSYYRDFLPVFEMFHK